MNTELGSRQPASKTGAAKTNAAELDHLGHCVLKAIEQLALDSEPYRVRLLAEETTDRVVTDGAFFGTTQRLMARGLINMVRHRRCTKAGDTSCLEVIGIYQLTETGHQCLQLAKQSGSSAGESWPTQAVGMFARLLPAALRM